VDLKGNVYVFDYADYVIRKFDPQGRLLTAFGGKGEEPGSFQHLMAIRIHGDSLLALDPGSLTVFDLSGNLRSRQILADTVTCDHPRLHPDGRWAAAACGVGGARVWSTGRPQAFCAIRTGVVVDVRFLRDASALLTSGSAGLLRWPIRQSSSTEEWIFGPPQPLGIRGERFSVDDRAQVIAIGHGHHAAVYQLEGNRSLAARFPHSNLSRLQLSSSGRWLVTVTWHGRNVRVWDVQAAKLQREFPSESARACFSPDERWLVIGTGASYSVFDAETWSERWSLSREGAGDLPTLTQLDTRGTLTDKDDDEATVFSRKHSSPDMNFSILQIFWLIRPNSDTTSCRALPWPRQLPQAWWHWSVPSIIPSI